MHANTPLICMLCLAPCPCCDVNPDPAPCSAETLASFESQPILRVWDMPHGNASRHTTVSAMRVSRFGIARTCGHALGCDRGCDCDCAAKTTCAARHAWTCTARLV